MNAISKKRIYKKIRPACLFAAALALCSCSSSSLDSSSSDEVHFGTSSGYVFTFDSFAEFKGFLANDSYLKTDKYHEYDYNAGKEYIKRKYLDFLIPNLDGYTAYSWEDCRLFTRIEFTAIGAALPMNASPEDRYFELYSFSSLTVRYLNWDVSQDAKGTLLDYDISLAYPYTVDTWNLDGSFDSSKLSYITTISEDGLRSATVTFSYDNKVSWNMNVSWAAGTEEYYASGYDSAADWLASVICNHLEYLYLDIDNTYADDSSAA